MTPPSPILTVPAAAARLGISPWSYYRGIQRGDLPHIRVGSRLLVPEVALDEFLRTGHWAGRAAS